jgi:hypothetical protein
MSRRWRCEQHSFVTRNRFAGHQQSNATIQVTYVICIVATKADGQAVVFSFRRLILYLSRVTDKECLLITNSSAAKLNRAGKLYSIEEFDEGFCKKRS